MHSMWFVIRGVTPKRAKQMHLFIFNPFRDAIWAVLPEAASGRRLRGPGSCWVLNWERRWWFRANGLFGFCPRSTNLRIGRPGEFRGQFQADRNWFRGGSGIGLVRSVAVALPFLGLVERDTERTPVLGYLYIDTHTHPFRPI